MEKEECLEVFHLPIAAFRCDSSCFLFWDAGKCVCPHEAIAALKEQLWIDPRLGKSFCCTVRGIQRMLKVYCQDLRDSHFISEFVLDLVVSQCFGCCLVPMEGESKACQNTTVCCRHRAEEAHTELCPGVELYSFQVLGVFLRLQWENQSQFCLEPHQILCGQRECGSQVSCCRLRRTRPSLYSLETKWTLEFLCFSRGFSLFSPG